jgi:nitric oxide reductase activation protein
VGARLLHAVDGGLGDGAGKAPKFGELAVVDKIIDDNRKLTQRLKHLLDALQPQGVQRIRKLEEGDEADINAAIRALVDIRLGSQPDPRVMMRSLRKTRLAGMEGRFSTRMGAAIRHAGHHLAQVRAQKSCSSSSPTGRQPISMCAIRNTCVSMPARRSRMSAATASYPSGLTLDPRADQYVARIFGARNYLILDHVERLPLLYAGLTR